MNWGSTKCHLTNWSLTNWSSTNCRSTNWASMNCGCTLPNYVCFNGKFRPKRFRKIDPRQLPKNFCVTEILRKYWKGSLGYIGRYQSLPRYSNGVFLNGHRFLNFTTLPVQWSLFGPSFPKLPQSFFFGNEGKFFEQQYVCAKYSILWQKAAIFFVKMQQN
jgi:hypothetical protein